MLTCPMCGLNNISGVYMERGECEINGNGCSVAGNRDMQEFTILGYICRDCQHESASISVFQEPPPQCPSCKSTVIYKEELKTYTSLDTDGKPITDGEFQEPPAYFCPACGFKAREWENFRLKK